MSKPKNKIKTAADGGSATLRSAFIGRPGGTHGRRKPQRSAVKRRAIEQG